MSSTLEKFPLEELETSFRPSLDPSFEPKFEPTFEPVFDPNYTTGQDQTRMFYNQSYENQVYEPQGYHEADQHYNQNYKLHESSTALVRFVPDFRTDPFYHKVLQHMQRGEWQQSVLLLKAVTEKYPNALELEWLMQDALVRAEIEQAWGEKIKDTSTIPSQILRIVMRVLAVVLVVLLVGAGGWYYVQLKQSNAATAERLSLLTQAQTAMSSGNYAEAIELFDQLLAKDPENKQALSGKEEAVKQMEVATEYDAALAAFNAKDSANALILFKALDEKSPGYKDVAQRIKQLESTLDLKTLFAQADEAYKSEKWELAIQLYEEVYTHDSNYQSETVVEHLVTAYNKLGLQMVAGRPAAGDDLSKPFDYFRRVLRLKTSDEVAQRETDLLEHYRAGVTSLTQNSLPQAQANFEAVYKARPDYLGGFLLEQLYKTYLAEGDQQMAASEFGKALVFYRSAMELPIADKSQAIKMVTKASIAMQPTATPTQTPEPTATPVPPTQVPVRAAQPAQMSNAYAAGSSAAQAPIATAPPPPRPLTDFRGWIMFLRNGSYYVMQPDGSGQQEVSASDEKYQELYEIRQWSPDHKTRVYVTENPGGDDPADLWTLRADLPENWNRNFLLNDYPKYQYDPAWSPNNQWIAFVSNHTGGDEIWVVEPQNGTPRQLTHNGWEWDKHPTWTADGSKIIFFSNRTGKSQIWSMNADGSDQRNISNSQFDDTHPVLVR